MPGHPPEPRAVDLETCLTPLFETPELEFLYGKLVARFPGSDDEKITDGEGADGREPQRLGWRTGHPRPGGRNAVQAECAVRQAYRFDPKVASQQRTDRERDRVLTSVHERLSGPGPADDQFGALDPECG